MTKAGDNVTYVDANSEPYFAIVTRVVKIEGREDSVIDLTVFGPTGPYVLNGVKENAKSDPKDPSNEYVAEPPKAVELPATLPVAPAPTPLPPAPVAPVITDAEGEAWARAHGFSTAAPAGGPVPRPGADSTGAPEPVSGVPAGSNPTGQPEASTGSPTQQQAQQTPGGSPRETAGTSAPSANPATPANTPGTFTASS